MWAADRLCLAAVPLVPEVRLYLADDVVELWEYLETGAGTVLEPPFFPLSISKTLDSLTSTPTTECPRLARHAEHTDPT